MDIHLQKASAKGRILESEDGGPPTVELVLPLTFSDLSTLQSRRLVSLTVLRGSYAGRELLPGTAFPCRGVSTGREFELPNELRKDDDSDANTIEAVFRLRTVDETPPPARGEVDLVLEVHFSHALPVSFRIHGHGQLMAGNGSLTLSDLERVSAPGPIVGNLALTAALTGVLLAWNTFLNGNVHAPVPWLASTATTTAIGAALAFVGLSLTGAVNLVATLSRVQGLIKLPELHFQSSTAALLKEGSYRKWLAGVATVSALVVAFAWSRGVRPIDDEGFVYWDGDIDREMESDRVYMRHSRSGRVGVICADHGPAGVPVGRLAGGPLSAGAIFDSVVIEFPGSLLPSRPSPFVGPLPAASMLALDGENGWVREALCSGEESLRGDYMIREDTVLAREYGVERGLRVYTREPKDYDHVADVLNGYRETNLQKHTSTDAVWRSRQREVEVLSSKVQQVRGYLSAEQLTRHAVELWRQVELDGGRIARPQQAIERAIMIRALLDAYRSQPKGPMHAGHLDSMMVAYERFGLDGPGSHDWRAIRSQWEVWFDVKATSPDFARAIERLLPGPPEQWHSWTGGFTVQLLRACIQVQGCVDQPPSLAMKDFLADRWPNIQAHLNQKGLEQTVEALSELIRRQEVPLPPHVEDLRPVVRGFADRILHPRVDVQTVTDGVDSRSEPSD